MSIPLHIQEEIAGHLDAIAALFKNPKMTLLIRNPDIADNDGDMLLGNDSFEDAEKALNFLRTRPVKTV